MPSSPDPLVAAVAGFRAARPHAELELRLGTHGEGRFVAGVSRARFEQFERDLVDAALEADKHWVELVDYHYVTARGEKARTRVEFDAVRMEMGRTHVSKRAVCGAVLRRDEGGEACRAALSHEVPLDDPPGVCVTTHVRLHQRRTFRDVRGGAVVWSYELSKTWSGGSRTAVEHLQHDSEPTFEVECELVDADGAYLAARTDAQVAASLRLKAQLLLGEDDDVLETLAEAPAPHTGGGSGPSRQSGRKQRRTA